MVTIRPTDGADEPAIRQVHESAFGQGAGEGIADLTIELLHDPTAGPVLSLLACDRDLLIGHVLFTRVHISGLKQSPPAHILAPLAVLPDRQGQRVGTQLVETGLERLADSGSTLVFVLGYPAYYTRFGFRPAGVCGFCAPYPIPEKDADAWMVLALREGVIGSISGTVQCADALNKQEHWCE